MSRATTVHNVGTNAFVSTPPYASKEDIVALWTGGDDGTFQVLASRIVEPVDEPDISVYSETAR